MQHITTQDVVGLVTTAPSPTPSPIIHYNPNKDNRDYQIPIPIPILIRMYFKQNRNQQADEQNHAQTNGLWALLN